MGSASSKQVLSPELPEDERYFGLENFGNTCYANSVLQALFFCKPFRQKILAYAASHLPPNASKPPEENLLTCLAELFQQINSQKKKTGCISPRQLLNYIRANHYLFKNSIQHQDAHEFLSYILNEITEIVAKEKQNTTTGSNTSSLGNIIYSNGLSNGTTAKATAGLGATGRVPSLGQLQAAAAASNNNSSSGPPTTWIQDTFLGHWVNEIQCLRCESITRTKQTFTELQLDIKDNCSITSCLKRFSFTEMLEGDDKFACSNCGGSLQEARRRTRLVSLPPVLCLHLKRFIYTDSGQLKKVMSRVNFPTELKLWNTTEDCPNADDRYELFSCIVHSGGYLHHGHYYSLVKSSGHWLVFDDNDVTSITQDELQRVFGGGDGVNGVGGGGTGGHLDHGYILMYQRVEV
jgi:ubiquitin carboxyl-terminal hydrolase 12/46